MRILVRIISGVGLIGYAGFVFLLFALGGMSASSTGPAGGPMFFFCVVPFLYLLYCFFSTFDYLTRKALLASGIVAHLAMVPVVIITLQGASTAIIGIGALGMIGAWYGMYFQRRPKRDA
jgi:hypothetical protein